MPKIVDRDQTKSLIREAARAVYAERGLAQTGLVHVARRAGMGRATLYHYYPTKEALVADIAEELLAEETDLFARAVAEGKTDPIAAIAGVAETVTRLYADWAEEGSIVLQFWAEHPDRFRDALTSIRKGLAGLIRRGQRSGEIDASLDPMGAATVVAGIIDGVLLQYFLDPAAHPDGRGVSTAVHRAVMKVLQP